jgi:hypothetical protein
MQLVLPESRVPQLFEALTAIGSEPLQEGANRRGRPPRGPECGSRRPPLCIGTCVCLPPPYPCPPAADASCPRVHPPRLPPLQSCC